jgi:hypothetical protein
MVKTLKDKYTSIRTSIIKGINFTWIANKILSVINVDLNIYKEALDIILEEKYSIKPHPMQL